MKAFAGNLLEVSTTNDDRVILISQSAFRVLLPGQLNAMSKLAELLPISIPTIEKCGGGSVRCMVAGIHLQKRNTL
jgi:arginine N-succinyltransferase